MPNQSDLTKVYDICDEIYDEFKERLNELSSELAKTLVKRLRDNDIPTREQTGEHTCSDSKQKLVAEDRLLSLCSTFEFNFRFTCLSEDF